MISNSSVVSKDLFAKIKIEDIRIGKRYRNEIGDISKLVEGIKNNGLLCTITVTKDGLLVVGLRRIEAHKKLGIEYIPSQCC
jgi:ParB-like chromosome segregation protein Spo0J